MSKPKANTIIIKPGKKGTLFMQLSPEQRADQLKSHRRFATQLNFKIEFDHTPEAWRGRVTVFHGDDPDPLWVAGKSHASKSYFKTEQDFQHWFFERVRRWVLDRATHGIMYAPQNYTGEFWNAAFLKRLMKRTKGWRTKGWRTKKAFGLEVLDNMLSWNWKEKDWNGMDRDQLLKEVKCLDRFFSKPLTAGGVWQRAYRLGLFSKRSPGPKARL